MAYAFNEDRSKVDVYTEDEIDAMHIVDKETIDTKNADQDQKIALQTSRIDTIVENGTGGIEVRELLWEDPDGASTSVSGYFDGSANDYDCLEFVIGKGDQKKICRTPVTGGALDFTYGYDDTSVTPHHDHVQYTGLFATINAGDDSTGFILGDSRSVDFDISSNLTAPSWGNPDWHIPDNDLKFYAIYGIKYAQDCSTEVADIRVGYDGFIYPTAGDAVRDQIDDIVSKNVLFERYLYKRDTYIKADGTEASLSDYDTYRIPISQNDLVFFEWSGNFWYNLNSGYAINIQKTDDTFTRIGTGGTDSWYIINSAMQKGIFIIPPDYKFFYVTVYRGRENLVSIHLNEPCDFILNDESVVRKSETALPIENGVGFKSRWFLSNSGFSQLVSGYATYAIKVEKDDIVTFGSLAVGISFYANFLDFSTNTVSHITTQENNVIPNDGILFVLQLDNVPAGYLTRKDQIKVDYSNIVNKPESGLNGKVWVSFGDSITYQDKWQPHVVSELGLTHENCGIGSTALSGSDANAFWQTTRLDAVKAYNPDVVTILGGANDLVLNPVIGDSSNLVDKDTSTFIGAYSYIIDNLLTWKPSLKIIILGTTWAHNNGADMSSILTYKDFSDACELVADYYQLPFIDLWSNSGFNKYTMNSSPYNIYSADHIHPNDAGGKIIAAQVIAKLKEVYGVK